MNMNTQDEKATCIPLVTKDQEEAFVAKRPNMAKGELVIRHPPPRLPPSLRKGKSSRYRGVFWSKVARKWAVIVRSEGRLLFMGLHGSEEDAARAYDAAVLRLGENRL